MQQQQHEVPLQTLNSNAGFHQGPMQNMAPSSTSAIPHANDQAWQHFLTNIPPAVSSKLTAIGIFYIIVGLLNIGLEFGLVFGPGISLYGAFVNGPLLFIAGVVTLVLCRQQIYTLTSLFVLLIFQLHVIIITLIVYFYFTITLFANWSSYCSHAYTYRSCSDRVTGAVVLIMDLIHLITTIVVIIVNLVIIRNARRPPMIPLTSNYTMYNPQLQAMPVVYHNPYATSANSVN